MRPLISAALVAVIISLLWSQYGMGAGLLALALAVIVFIATALEVVEAPPQPDAWKD
jgi:hypothetical protein